MLQIVVHLLARPTFRIRNVIYTRFANVIIVIKAIRVIVIIHIRVILMFLTVHREISV